MTDTFALRRCHHCGRPQDEGVELKKCAGCASVVYCSKECQKAAWKIHKPACPSGAQERALNQATKNLLIHPFGFKNGDECSQAVRDFVEAHSWAFTAYTKALVTLSGGPDRALDPPKLLEIELECLCAPGLARNPANTFRFVGHRWRTADDFGSTPDGADNWERSEEVRALSNETHAGEPSFAGVLPVLYSITRINLWQTFFYPLYRPTLIKDPETGREIKSSTEMDPALLDVLAVCKGSVRLGLSLRCVAGQRSIPALPGQFVRTNKRWTWEPLFGDWEKYLDGPRPNQTVNELLSLNKFSGLEVPSLLYLIRRMR
ncbi:hypothetical protein C8Q79DRAFT_915383 [Trametes meyenii]|nr:hypothetical protein C8Q79DRAFT_915383 [Trametes meyenii]